MQKTKQKIKWTVRGHEDMKGHLEKQLRADKTSHAYLFFGPGKKLRFARDFSKIILCEGKDKPCDRGACCRLFDLGHHHDFILLKKEKGDTQIKIEAVRNVIQRVSLKAHKRRVILIQEAELLSDSAANALLKIIEESKKETIFILTTYDVDSLLPTVSSRCQKFYLGRKNSNFALSGREKEITKFLKKDIVGRFEIAKLISKSKKSAKLFVKELEKQKFFEMREKGLEDTVASEEIIYINKTKDLLKTNVSARLILENLALKLKVKSKKAKVQVKS